MLCCNTVHEVCDYASAAVYRECPNIEQIRAGVVPLDSLPAAWWNWMWWDTNTAVNEARDAVGAFVNEFNTVLQAAGVCADCTCVDQLYQAIEKIRKTIGTATCPGAVKSSSVGGQVSIDNDGLMTVNCFGNASSLTTQARTLVGAINELKSTYDCDFTDVGGAIDTLTNCKAPNMHASSTTTYGVGNASCYGHVKLSDTFDQVLASCEGVAASQYALATVFSCIATCGGAPIGNTVACPIGSVASAGVCSTAARSDHVHPVPAVPLLCDFLKKPSALFSCSTVACPYNYNMCRGNFGCNTNVYTGYTVCITPENACFNKPINVCCRIGTFCAFACMCDYSGYSYSYGTSITIWNCTCMPLVAVCGGQRTTFSPGQCYIGSHSASSGGSETGYFVSTTQIGVDLPPTSALSYMDLTY